LRFTRHFAFQAIFILRMTFALGASLCPMGVISTACVIVPFGVICPAGDISAARVTSPSAVIGQPDGCQLLEAISKMSFDPNPVLDSRFNSSKYFSIPAG
jgi:hypothetical protein